MNDLKLSYQNTHEFLIRCLIKFLKAKKYKEKISILEVLQIQKKKKFTLKDFLKDLSLIFIKEKSILDIIG